MEPIEFRPDDIRAARERIGPYVRRTPVLELERVHSDSPAGSR
jgi:hypothetical protein